MEAEPTDQTDPTYKEYMRLYRLKMYKKNPDKIKTMNKVYYYKTKFNCSTEEMQKYGVFLPNVLRIRKDLDILRATKPELLKDILVLCQ